jgi:hypothetical protein
MPDEFEETGTISAVEQKRYRDGGGLIPGFWSVKLQTPSGERSVSFNSERRKDPRDRNSPTEPHPDFGLIQRALASGETIRIRGHLTRKGEGENARTFKNGTSAELIAAPAAEGVATQPSNAAGAASAPEPQLEDAKWAVETVLPQAGVDSPMSDRDLERVKQEAEKLLDATRDVADGSLEDDANSTTPSELERRREQRRRREGLA